MSCLLQSDYITSFRDSFVPSRPIWPYGTLKWSNIVLVRISTELKSSLQRAGVFCGFQFESCVFFFKHDFIKSNLYPNYYLNIDNKTNPITDLNRNPNTKYQSCLEKQSQITSAH